MKIVIIGAGIAGLTAGLACQRAGMDVKIFDKAKALQTIGGGLLLWPHGLRFLNDIGMSAALREAWTSVRRVNIISHRGTKICSDNNAELNALMDGEIQPIDRSQLQKMLVAQLDNDALFLGKTCTNIFNHDEYAEAIFADGTSVRADLIIGADGVNSAVRQAILPQAQPAHTGFCWWGGMVNHDVIPHLPLDEVHYILGQRKFFSLWPTHGERFMWYLPVKMSLDEFSANNAELQAQELCRGWNDDIQRIIAAPQHGQRFHLPIYELPPQARCSSGRTVLIGDAALTFGPLLGQGANKAIEDACLLVAFMQKHSHHCAEKLSNYDDSRRARHQRFYELEQMSAQALIHDTREELQFFESQLPNIDLVTMYQDMIPLVNAAACEKLEV